VARIVKAGDVEPKKVRWLWRNRIARGVLTTVAGKPDQGKGLFSSRSPPYQQDHDDDDEHQPNQSDLHFQ